MTYFEHRPHRKRYAGFSGCYAIPPEPFVAVWNRFVARWNEVECNLDLPLHLHDEKFNGARVFSTATSDNSEVISHPDWLVELFFTPACTDRWGAGRFNTSKVEVPPDAIALVECHYRTLDNREDIHAWLAQEQARFASNNHYDNLLAFRSAA